MRNSGVAGAIKSSTNGWDKNQGEFVETVWRGTGQYIKSIFLVVRQDPTALSIEQSNEGAVWELRARFLAADPSAPENSPTENSVRMQINRVQKSIFEPPGPAGITANQLRIIKDAIQNPGKFTTASIGIVPGTDAYDLYQLALSGVDFRTVEQPVIYVTRVKAPSIGWPDKNNGVGYNFSTAQMVADSDIGSLLNFNLPPDSGIFQWASEDGSTIEFAYGWLKHAPHYDVTAGNRSIEFLEYEFGLWPTLLYPLN